MGSSGKTSVTLHAMPDRSFDPYRILGLDRAAGAADVARAYRQLAKRRHPDLNGPDAEREMLELNRAVRILSDPDRRHAWDASHAAAPRSREHWAAAARPPAPGNAGGGPVVWAGSETASPSVGSGADRVRVREAWPRPPAPPVAAGGLRDSAWLAVGVALAVVVGALMVGGIAAGRATAGSPREAFGRSGLVTAAAVSIDPEREVDVYRGANGVIGLVAAERTGDGWVARMLVETTDSRPASVLLFVDADAPGDPLPSIAFGRAEGGVREVRVAGSGTMRTPVVDGTWAMAVPGITDPSALELEFVMVDGTVVHGDGEQVP